MKLYYAPGACSMAPTSFCAKPATSSISRRSTFPTRRPRAERTTGKSTRRATCRRSSSTTAGPHRGAGHLPVPRPTTRRMPRSAPKAGTMERYRLMEMLNFTASEIHKQIGALFNPR